jgi:hypothetical protein
MAERFMVLPSKDVGRMRLVSVPEDMSAHEAYRYVTGLVSEVPRDDDDHWLEGVLDCLEDHGFETVELVIGPSLD